MQVLAPDGLRAVPLINGGGADTRPHVPLPPRGTPRSFWRPTACMLCP
ncbi:MAG: hypothetical protein QOE59_42 [Actinomycetota bacterium]|nr:hypothetical protein [Actinomycetota bacterium]